MARVGGVCGLSAAPFYPHICAPISAPSAVYSAVQGATRRSQQLAAAAARTNVSKLISLRSPKHAFQKDAAAVSNDRKEKQSRYCSSAAASISVFRLLTLAATCAACFSKSADAPIARTNFTTRCCPPNRSSDRATASTLDFTFSTYRCACSINPVFPSNSARPGPAVSGGCHRACLECVQRRCASLIWIAWNRSRESSISFLLS